MSRLQDLARTWRIDVERIQDTPTSQLAFGARDGEPVVLKVVKARDDEWHSGSVLAAFDGIGAVRVLEHEEGALLMERAMPGNSLAQMALDGRDEEATEVLANLIGAMRPRMPSNPVTTVLDHGRALRECRDDGSIEPAMLQRARIEYDALCASQGKACLLHGDLHHDNVIFDASRGWLAIDPKGLAGELEYEVGAALRNPFENPALLSDPGVIARRIRCFERELGLDPDRVLRWAFAQAVLAAAWDLEEGQRLSPDNPWIALARSTHRLAGIC